MILIDLRVRTCNISYVMLIYIRIQQNVVMHNIYVRLCKVFFCSVWRKLFPGYAAPCDIAAANHDVVYIVHAFQESTKLDSN